MKNQAEMNDLQISKALALAIGWPECDVILYTGAKRVLVVRDDKICCFDYRDPAVIWPIAEKYFAFPGQYVDNDGKVIAWEAALYSEKTGSNHCLTKADTAAKAVALAVIASQYL